MYSHEKKSLVIAITLCLLPTVLLAAGSGGDSTSGSYNILLISLISLMLILLIAIGVLANVLRQMTFVVRDKIRKEQHLSSNMIKAVLLLFAISIPTINVLAEGNEAIQATSASTANINGIPVIQFYTVMTVIVLEVIVLFALTFFIRVLLRSLNTEQELVKPVKAVDKTSWFWDKFNAAAKIEQEKNVLLDHNYDGIQELDNSLPPWWKYGFYLTIVVAIIYLYRFQISHDGQSQHEEYVAEMQKGEEDKAAYLAKSANNVDENSVVLLTDGQAISEGHEVFIKTCAPCHLADGGGSVGPNLTDEYWLHGGSIKNIFKSIKYGWQDKGMKSWKDDLSPKQIQELASYIKTLKGSHPLTPKAPQGDLYIESTITDNKNSTANVVDSPKVGQNVIK